MKQREVHQWPSSPDIYIQKSFSSWFVNHVPAPPFYLHTALHKLVLHVNGLLRTGLKLNRSGVAECAGLRRLQSSFIRQQSERCTGNVSVYSHKSELNIRHHVFRYVSLMQRPWDNVQVSTI